MSDFFSTKLASSSSGVPVAFDWAGTGGEASAPGAGAAWSVAEAFLAVLFSAAASDGEIAGLEHEELLALIHRTPALRRLTTAALNPMGAVVLARLAAGGETALAEACASLPKQFRPWAFANALDLVLCDGQLLRDEADFLDALAAALRLDPGLVGRIAEITLLKNQYPAALPFDPRSK